MAVIKFVSNVEMSDDAFLSLKLRLNKMKNQYKDFEPKSIILIADNFLKSNSKLIDLQDEFGFTLIFYNNANEPTTEYIDELNNEIKLKKYNPICVIGFGGGSTLDSAKALSNILTNPGRCEDYQGWELVRNRGIYKIGMPTLFGTGAETSRTCVLTNPKKNIKLGMNSNFSVFDEIIIDPKMSMSAPKSTKLFTALDGYFHAIEILDGKNRNIIADSFAEKSLDHFVDFANSKSIEGDYELAMCSFYGGMALANGIVGLVHPFSAALSSVFGVSHAKGNCFAMKGLYEFYPKRKDYFWSIIEKYNLQNELVFEYEVGNEHYEMLFNSMSSHVKPLTNHLGAEWKKILNPKRVKQIFSEIARGV